MAKTMSFCKLSLIPSGGMIRQIRLLLLPTLNSQLAYVLDPWQKLIENSSGKTNKRRTKELKINNHSFAVCFIHLSIAWLFQKLINSYSCDKAESYLLGFVLRFCMKNETKNWMQKKKSQIQKEDDKKQWTFIRLKVVCTIFAASCHLNALQRIFFLAC